MKLAITFEELLQKEKEYAINQNIEKIYIDYLKDEYQLKIKNYCKKYNLNIEEVNSRIRAKDRITASIFIKDPLKQNITENLISVYLKTSKLLIGGKRCVRFDGEGNIVCVKGNNISKSADFYINGIYYTQKYTNEPGGAQDNQFADVEQFLRNGSKKHKVGAILDGNYWKIHKKILEKEFACNPNIKITCADKLREEITP